MGLTSVILEFIAGPEQGRKVCIAEFRPFLLGRGLDADVRLPAIDTSVSRQQAYIQISPRDCVLTIVAGANLVVRRNDAQIEGQCLLTDGDLLSFGTTQEKTIARVSLISG